MKMLPSRKYRLTLVSPVMYFLMATLSLFAVFAGANEQQFTLRKQKLDKGVFLIASRKLNDPNFTRTVILITRYNNEGTTGLVINRPLQVPVLQAFPELEKLNSKLGKLQLGGPVSVNSLQLLVRSKIKLSENTYLFADVFHVYSPMTLTRLLKNELKYEAIKLYVGYAGWAAGQLESELIRGDWYIWQADANSIFSKATEDIWPDLIALVSAKWASIPTSREINTKYNSRL